MSRRVLIVSHAAILPRNQLPYESLRDHGWEPTLVVPERWSNEYGTHRAAALEALAGSIRPARVVLSRPHRYAYLARLRRILRDERPDVVFVEEEPVSVAAFQWSVSCVRRGLPFGVRIDETLDRPLPAIARVLRRWTLPRASFAVARSLRSAHLAQQWGARNDVTVVPHAIPRWTPADARHGSPFTVGFAGRLVPEKGVRDLLAAARRLTPVRVVYIGNGPLREELASSSADGVDVEVRTNVAHSQMPDAYADMDVLVLPSRTTPTWAEQFGRVVPEALMCGVPVVGSDSGEIPWVVNETGGGLIFAEGDVDDLASKIETLRADPALRARLAATGRGNVERLFSPEAAAAALARALDGALA